MQSMLEANFIEYTRRLHNQLPDNNTTEKNTTEKTIQRYALNNIVSHTLGTSGYRTPAQY